MGTVFLDLSKAFDLVDQNLLLSKFWGNITWIIHLCGGLIHTLRVEHSAAILNGSLSDALTLTQGVPQGSILGPVIFSLYQ